MPDLAYRHTEGHSNGDSSTPIGKADDFSAKVGDDGRVQFHIHDNSDSVVNWFQRLQDTPKASAKSRIKSSSNVPLSAQETTKPPRLNIAIHIVGSHGDVQPFIPIAQLLSGPLYGHRVRICTHPVFKDFVEGQGVEFFSIGGDPEALMSYMVRNPGLLPNRKSLRAGDVGNRRKDMWDIITGCWMSCIKAGNGIDGFPNTVDVLDARDLFIADAIIANPPSMAHIHCAERLGIPLHMVFTMPWSPTQVFSHPFASVKVDANSSRSTSNYFSFMMMELLTWQGLGDLVNKFRTQMLLLDAVSPMWGFQLLDRLKVPYTYLWSQSLIPKPLDWGSHIDITGFSFLEQASSYTPPPDLAEFLEKGPAPIYIGFGSIVIDDPAALTIIILEATKIAGVRAVVSKGWSGIGVESPPDNVFFVGNVPHDWLFKHVAAVVHHGGAGTTAAGIATGRPTVVVPFFGDQAFWGQMIARSGAGPAPIRFKDLTAEKLANGIKFALKPHIREKLNKMAEQIMQEDGARGAALDFQSRLNIDQMRCDMCPDRVAVWYHKKTGARLSSYAGACLVIGKHIEAKDLKTYRCRQWYVDEGAEHPLVGAIAALTGLFTSLGIAGSEFRRRMRERHDAHKVEKEMAELVEPVHTADSTAPRVSVKEMERFARKMATKSLQSSELLHSQLKHTPTFHDRRKASWKNKEQGQYGKHWYRARATGRMMVDVTSAVVQSPVAFFYNVANGFHNYPSYGWLSTEVRRRDDITGLSTGLKTASKGFVLGWYDAVSGIILNPYKGAKKEGLKGGCKGVLNGGTGFLYGINAATFGLIGYTLKGIEREFSKHHMSKLDADLFLIRIRRSLEELRETTQEDKDAVVAKWKLVYS